MAVLTLFGQAATGSSIVADTGSYTMGVQFSVSSSGLLSATLSAVWFYSASGAVSLPSNIVLYKVSGQVQVASQAASWSGAVGSGWVRAPFTVPPALTFATSYKACIFDNAASNFYSSTVHYWDTGAGSAGVTNQQLAAPNNAGGDGGQDTFTVGGIIAYPATSSNAANYWMDPEVTTVPAPPAARQQQQSGRSMLRKRLMYADV